MIRMDDKIKINKIRIIQNNFEILETFPNLQDKKRKRENKESDIKNKKLAN
jgi:hypothetical protein